MQARQALARGAPRRVRNAPKVRRRFGGHFRLGRRPFKQFPASIAMKLFLCAAVCLAAVATAVPLINDAANVDAINAIPGITWKAGMNER